MPDLNISDSRGRDAVVSGESTNPGTQTFHVNEAGEFVRSCRMLQATAEHTLDGLRKSVGDDLAKIGEALIEGDPEVDLERFGGLLTDLSRVYVNPDGEVVHAIEQFEIVKDPSGEVKERRPRERPEGNVDSEVPLTWTGRLMKRDEAARRFLFANKLQIRHVNGLTYDFLFGMARELHDADSMVLLGAGEKGDQPLVFRRGSIPYRGFLEGRVDGDRYALILHLSNQELKPPEPVEPPEKKPAPTAKKPAAKKKAPAKKKSAAKKSTRKKKA